MNTTSAPLAVNPLSPAQAKSLLKEGSIILWLYRGAVEEGTVQFVSKSCAGVIWLEGYKSRNDDVPFDEILAVHSTLAPEHKLSVFRGKGFLTAAGAKWIADNEKRDAFPPDAAADAEARFEADAEAQLHLATEAG